MNFFIKPLEIKEIKKNFRNLLKQKQNIKDVDRPYSIYTTIIKNGFKFQEDEFYYYMKEIFKNNKKEYSEMKNKFKTLNYKSKNNCLEIHNKILQEIEKYKVFKNFNEDLMDYYYDHFNYPKYLKASQEIEKRETYDLLYSFEFLNEKELRRILFEFFI